MGGRAEHVPLADAGCKIANIDQGHKPLASRLPLSHVPLAEVSAASPQRHLVSHEVAAGQEIPDMWAMDSLGRGKPRGW